MARVWPPLSLKDSKLAPCLESLETPAIVHLRSEQESGYISIYSGTMENERRHPLTGSQITAANKKDLEIPEEAERFEEELRIT